MPGLNRGRLCLIGLALLVPVLPAVAMPIARAPAEIRMPYVIDAQVMCDARGCFGYGQQQWYRPPNFPPSYLPPNRPPIYYRPRAAGVPSAPYYRNVPQQPARQAPPLITQPSQAISRHTAWCMDRYPNFNPESNRYRLPSGREQRCVSPFD